MRNMTKRSVVVASAVAVSVVGAGAAWAAWSLTGTGAANATAGSAAELTVTNVTVTQLTPNVTGNVVLTVNNPNPFPVRVTGFTFTGLTKGQGEDCNVGANITFPTGTLSSTPADLLVPAKVGASNGTKTITYTGSIRMKADADDNCQGAVFSFTTGVNANSEA
ncbi:hypothetical protein Areg01_26140 [Actinoplanes regularis]|nr:hypothetical protein Areg01_26140 [Actinoplanes regularis]